MHINTYFRQSWFSGARLGAGGCPGHWGDKASFRTQDSIIPSSHEACSYSPQTTGEVGAKLMSGAEEQFPFITEWLDRH